MDNKKPKKEKPDSLLKSLLREIRESIILEIAWNILMFIPKMIIRFIRNIW